MKDPSLAIIMNKLQKGIHPLKPLPNTYFLNTGVIYCCVQEGSQSFEAVVVQRNSINCHDLMGHNGTTQLYVYIRRLYFWQKLKQDCTKYMHQCTECQQVPLKEPSYVDSNL